MAQHNQNSSCVASFSIFIFTSKCYALVKKTVLVVKKPFSYLFLLLKSVYPLDVKTLNVDQSWGSYKVLLTISFLANN